MMNPDQKSKDEDRLQDELEDSFPASDPPSMTQPKSKAGAPAGKKTPEDAARKKADDLGEVDQTENQDK